MFLLRTLTTVFINNIASSSNNNLECKKQVRCKLYYKRIHKENNAN